MATHVVRRFRELDATKQQRLFGAVKTYLLKLNNMLTNYVDETFEDVTGEATDR